MLSSLHPCVPFCSLPFLPSPAMPIRDRRFSAVFIERLADFFFLLPPPPLFPPSGTRHSYFSSISPSPTLPSACHTTQDPIHALQESLKKIENDKAKFHQYTKACTDRREREKIQLAQAQKAKEDMSEFSVWNLG